MERLRAETREAVNLGVLDDFRTVSLHLVESTHPVGISMRIGGLPAHATATGKILLAALDPAEVSRRLGGRPMERVTERTIKSRPALLAELAQVREQGFALDDEECSLGMRCVGAPIRDDRGVVVAALSVVAPCHRLPPAAISATVLRVREAAREISSRLGYTPGSEVETDPSRAGRRAGSRRTNTESRRRAAVRAGALHRRTPARQKEVVE
jgi:DNA-binding IclR family transcriptional regulator